MESDLVIGGDQPFVRRLIGVSIFPMVGAIYNMGVWDKVAAGMGEGGGPSHIGGGGGGPSSLPGDVP